jgi:bifunctional DNA-binding transcriptional regulator/antitoxin component of YhaV-PrlF toxin-antitoxin module
MIRQMLRNGQVTLPKEAVDFFHLKTRDLVDVEFDRSGIHLKPLAVEEFSQAEYAKLAKKLDALKKRSKGRIYATTSEARLHLDRLMRS